MGNFFTALAGNDHQVVTRDGRTPVVEKVPFIIRFQLAVLFATYLGNVLVMMDFLRNYILRLTDNYGAQFSHPDSKKLIPHFAEAYGVCSKEASLPMEDYPTLNDFFHRELKAGARPIHKAGDAEAAIQPCDCRLSVFTTLTAAKSLWIKGTKFTGSTLTGGAWPEEELEGASVVVCRLAPTDYHRFHAPVAGRITRVTNLGRSLYTVKPVAINSRVDVLGENKRQVLEVESEAFGKVLYVVVGATHVGSIILTHKVGDKFDKGDELGYFAYGGSTVVALFQPGALRLDDDLVLNSEEGLETLVQMGDSLGAASSDGSANGR